MATSGEPTVLLSTLHRADGSATFSQNGYTVIGSVNGPIEVQRRDELPEEAVIDVTIRPAAGIGGTRERHLESILQSTLRQIILIHNFPRTLIQITLQITNIPESDSGSLKIAQAALNLPILPALLQTAVLSLLSASMPLAMSMNSVFLVAKRRGPSIEILQHPTVHDIEEATSVHVLGFSSNGDLLVAESEGSFSLEEWEELYDFGKRICYIDSNAMGSNDGSGSGSMQRVVQSVLETKVTADLHWRG